MIQLFALQMSFTNNYKRVTGIHFKKAILYKEYLLYKPIK